jgi:hypothetical protein
MLGIFADDRPRSSPSFASPKTQGNSARFSTLFTVRVKEGRGVPVTPSKGNDMFTKGVHAEFASANFHPEFGYLCPTGALRRKLRGAAVTILAGTMIAAGTALALMPQLAPHPSGDGARVEPVPSVMPSIMAMPAIDQAADRAEVSRPATAAATIAAPVTERAAAARAFAACDDLSGSFLAAHCQLGKTGKSHLARTAHPASNRVASVSIGRAGPGVEAEPQAPAVSAPPAESAAAVPTAVAANEASALLPPEKRPAPAKKPVKLVHKPVPGRDVASVDPPPSRGFNLFSLFHQSPRTGNGVSTTTW